MRTTLDIDDDLLLAAKELARRDGVTAGQIVSRLLRHSLTGVAEPVSNGRGKGYASVAGFQPFAAKPGVVTTLEQLNALRELEGI